MMNMLKKRVLSVLLAAAMLPLCGSYTGVVKVTYAVAAEDSEAAQTRPMTLDDVRALSTKGEGLRWSDFDEFEGDKFFIGKVKYCTFHMDDGYGLSVQGEPDKELVKAHLFRYVYDPGYPKIDIRRDDVESFIEHMTTQTLGTQSDLKTTTSKTTTSTTTTSKTTTTTTTAVTTSAAEATSTSTKKRMNMDEVRELSKKGMDLTWEDLAPYGCKTTGDGIHSAAHDFYFGDGYCFSVCGQPPVKLQTVELFYKDRSNSIDIRTGDIDLFIQQNTAGDVPDFGYTYDEIKVMTTAQVEEIFAARGLTGDHYDVCCQDYTSMPEGLVDKMRFSVFFKPENYMINLTDGELVTRVDSKKDIDKLPKDTDFVWRNAKVLKSLGLPEDIFDVNISTFSMLDPDAPSGDFSYGVYCKCTLICKEKDTVKEANLLSAAMNYAQLNPDFAFISSELNNSPEQPETPDDSRFSIEEHCVQFKDAVDAAWVLTNDSYDEGSMDKAYKFYPSDGGKYLLLTLDYSEDVRELAEQPDMPGVDCTMQSYIVECSSGKITVRPDKEYAFPYPVTEEEVQESLAQKETIFAKAFELMGSDHFFQCIRLRGVDNGFTNILQIRSSSDGKVSVSREDTDGTSVNTELLPAAEDKEAGTKRFTVNGSFMIGDERDHSKPVTEISISKTEKDEITSYDVTESFGLLMPSSLKVSTFKKGDVSGDGSFNVADIVLLQRWLLGQNPENFKNWKAADLNGDDVIDVFDLTAAKKYLVETM